MHWRRKWQPTPVFSPEEPQGRGSLVGCRLWGRKESDMTKRLHFHFSFSCIGEGNGNPLQYSCLENPRDGGAWWAAVYGVAQSRTRLKWLSSSSSKGLKFYPWVNINSVTFTFVVTSLIYACVCLFVLRIKVIKNPVICEDSLFERKLHLI